MSWCERRAVLASLAGLGALALLPGCRFEPALQRDGGALTPLYGQIEVNAPGSAFAFVLTQQIEDRLGRGSSLSPYTLSYELDIDSQSLGTDRAGTSQRVQFEGRAGYTLTRRGDPTPLAQGFVTQFTGYSTTGNTVSTRAAEGDAQRRLARMLADRIVERLLLTSPDLAL